MIYNKHIGKLAESQARRDLNAEGYKILGSQVRVKTKLGIRIIDFLVRKNGRLTAIEVKAGNAIRNTNQLAKDEIIAKEGVRLPNTRKFIQYRDKKLPIQTEVKRYN